MTEIIPPPASIMEARCKETGNMIICLYYLSQQAQAANFPDMAKVINQALTKIVAIGVKMQQEYLQESLAENLNDESVFIKNFCQVNDEAIKFGIQEIFYQK